MAVGTVVDQVVDDDGDDDDDVDDAEESSSGSDDNVEARVSKLEEALAACLQSMDPVGPGVIQAVQARHALWCCGRAFRRGHARARRSRRVSFSTGRIQQFWSHSWHGSTWNKILTAMYLHNGCMASLIATIVAAIPMVLFTLELLPMRFQEDPEYPATSYWTRLVGLLTYCAVLGLWQPRKHIFVDILCIDQGSPKAKTQALLSMGAFLKSSGSLLVLWDPSFTQRLRCPSTRNPKPETLNPKPLNPEP
ncbi:unnamed protein product [Symbiodinium natans]|uniref:Uncharacterized protein n=1 Tax=Symbiodinium natans TaxID=878477 RepID=A0A812PTM5_9DINO|nr:unnamed protein product [Symbiodinium natans]